MMILILGHGMMDLQWMSPLDLMKGKSSQQMCPRFLGPTATVRFAQLEKKQENA